MASAMASVIERLHEYEIQLLELIDRFKRVWAYEVELRKAARGKPFRMRNPEVWDVLLSDRDMFVIDFASWVTSLIRGFLDKLSMDDFSAFGVEEAPASNADDPYLARIQHEARVEAFARLFPVRSNEKKRWPDKPDFKRLRAELEKAAAGLEKQRDARAHLYDGKDHETAQSLRFEEVAAIFQHVLRIFRDMRLLVDHSGFHFPEVTEPTDDRTARDLVDVLLLGSIQHAVEDWMATPLRPGESRQFLWQHRAAWYEHVHRLHDDAGAPEKPLFNDHPEDES